MSLSAELGALLTAALRSRADSVGELAQLVGASAEEVTPALRELAELGFLSVTNDTITYRRPDVAIADFTRARIESASTGLRRLRGETDGMLGMLPGLLQSWQMGEAEDHSLEVDVLHGPYAAADIWRLQYSREIPAVSDVMMPDTSRLFTAKQEHQSTFWKTRAGMPIRVRLIMSVSDATHPDAADRVNAELEAGVQIRMHPNPPSWLWITDHETVGMPLEWGQGWPTSVLAVRSVAIAAQVSWIFDRVWAESVPVASVDHSWGAVLELMSRGMTMESATLALGMAPRTGRRRIAEAMKHFGADTHFALGAAWARAERRRSRVAPQRASNLQ